MKKLKGAIYGVTGPTVVAKGLDGVAMHTVCLVGKEGLLGEVIRIQGELATLQVYEDTGGLSAGEDVVSSGKPLMVVLGPGLLGGTFDGIQRPLDRMKEAGTDFIAKGLKIAPIDLKRVWSFSPLKRRGDRAEPGMVIGTVAGNGRIVHRVMMPPDLNGGGGGGVISEIKTGGVTGTEPVCVLEDGRTIGLYEEWPVRRPRPFKAKLPPVVPFVTGQRVFDTLFPVAEGGTAIVPGGFGTGKTIVEQTIAKLSKSDIVIYVGCGERGNEMTEILSDFPELKEMDTGLPLSFRTVIVVNTSNMPVAAREASIFTGITIAEYYRDMGYNVALLADSISRWAEALREISSRLEEMPGEEGFPPYLATHLGGFYERAGRVQCLGEDGLTGSITVVSAVSPPGGDFSEPVTQASLSFAGAFWALDPELAHRRHFPAVNWQSSFSLYYEDLAGWLSREVAPDMPRLRARLLKLLQKDAELKEVVQIIGVEALQEKDRLVLEAAFITNETFLKQSIFNEADAFNTHEKQYWMMKVIFAFLDSAEAALKKGTYLEKILESTLRVRVINMKNWPNEVFVKEAGALIDGIKAEFGV
ncbi:MAG: V-type ATP synthase subunit A [Deltaproteobacteria bacterium]|nr:V-type ATP synthase subunit A [Deltaproteobacteria bacterium]